MEAATDAGHPIPEDCIPPELSDHLIFVYVAFVDLNADRQTGFGVGPIPWTAINDYCLRYGIDDLDEFERFKTLIRAMDSEFCKPKEG